MSTKKSNQPGRNEPSILRFPVYCPPSPDEYDPSSNVPPTAKSIKKVMHVLDWYATIDADNTSDFAEKERLRILGLFRDYAGKLTLRECSGAVLLSFINKQKGVKANWTRRRWKATVNKPFNAAVEMGLLPYNPFRGVRIPEGPEGRDWTEEEFRAVLRESNANFKRLVVFLRFSGARPGEARSLRWLHIQQDVQAIVQEEHKTAHQGHGPRRIYLNHVVSKLLAWLRRHGAETAEGRRYRAKEKAARWRKDREEAERDLAAAVKGAKKHKVLPNDFQPDPLPEPPTPDDIAGTESDFVFFNSAGTPWTIRQLCNHFDLVKKRAGLAPDLKLHGCRHTFATNAIVNGVDIVTLAQLLGHRDISMTRRYLHLVHKQEHLNSAMQRAIGCDNNQSPNNTPTPKESPQ